MKQSKYYIRRSVMSFMLVLLLMPLGHALMILMEHFLSTTTLHYCAFVMGFAGMLITIAGVFTHGETKPTIFGLTGGLLFWTGWVEFLFSYYAWRYGVHCDLHGSGIVQTTSQYIDGIAVSHDFTVNGQALESFARAEIKALRGSRPEYLIMPATFGMWMMFMMLYIFSSRTGCLCFNWLQKKLHLAGNVELRPHAHHDSLVTFMELNLMMWSLYLVLMFCYDPVFLGQSHPVTFIIGIGCLVGSLFMFLRLIKISHRGANIRMAIANVLVFWTFIEVVAHNGLLNEVWVDPMNHISEMIIIAAAFVVVCFGLYLKFSKRNEAN